jgi:hypothetical protein
VILMRLPLLVTLAAFLLAACGQSEPPAKGEAGPPGPAGPSLHNYFKGLFFQLWICSLFVLSRQVSGVLRSGRRYWANGNRAVADRRRRRAGTALLLYLFGGNT